MNTVLTITAQPRQGLGTGAARQARREKSIPAVLYGPDIKDNVMLTLGIDEITKELHRGGFFSKIFNLEVDSKKYRVIPKEAQFHPLTDAVTHIDFLQINDNSKIAVSVPIEFTNQDKSPGIKRGGILNVVMHHLKIVCLAKNLPEKIFVDLESAQVGDSIYLHQVTLPAGSEPQADKRSTIATLMPPKVSAASGDKAKS